MTTLLPQAAIVYPSSDGEPLAETSVHVDAIIDAVVVLRQYLEQRSAIVLADQFLYYAQGYPKLRVAPDIMVILDVTPGPRDNYKIWEEGQVPIVIFEITSESTKSHDEGYKRILYEQLEVQEYWQFDPKGEWLEEQLRGYRLHGERYEPITDERIAPLQLRLSVDGQRIAFFREDTGEKLMASSELAQALREEVRARQQAEERAGQERQRAEQERQRAEQAEAQVAQLKERLRSLGIDPEL
jgi:Uma2 family endonuclease